MRKIWRKKSAAYFFIFIRLLKKEGQNYCYESLNEWSILMVRDKFSKLLLFID